MKRVIVGSITLYQNKCPQCKEKLLTGNPYPKCDCGYQLQKRRGKGFDIVVKPKRRKFSKEFRERLKEKQDNMCYWCGREFGEYIVRKFKVMRLTMWVDHNKPFIKTGNNEDDNIVAACKMCNIWKHSIMFPDDESCRAFLLGKWKGAIKSGEIDDLSEAPLCAPEGMFGISYPQGGRA
jgi:hypothetical protein